MHEPITLTPYPDVNAVLDRLVSSVQATLGDHVVAVYLYGSLSSGDFNPKTSDVDFLVVTRDVLPDDRIQALEAMHAQLWASGLKWAAKLEGSYIPQGALWRYDPAAGAFPTVNEGRFYVAPHGSDWIIQRHVIREHGAVLAGPDPHTLIAPVSADDIRRSVRGVLREWWLPMLDDPAFLAGRAEYQAYAVLTMCRALHALEHGAIVSKPVAARWAQAELGDTWADLIAWALAWQRGDPPTDLDTVLAFMGTVLERNGLHEA